MNFPAISPAWRIGGVFALAGLALALGAYVGGRSAAPLQSIATVAQISLPDIDKNLRHGDEWRGQVVVVNHWATWCPPCREEIPLLVDYQHRFGGRGLQIIGIAHDHLDDARVFGDSAGINYPSLVAISGGDALMRQQGNHRGALPFTAFFDRAGNLAHAQLGQLSAQDLDQALAPLW